MASTKKIKSTAMALMGIVSVVLLSFIIKTAKDLFTSAGNWFPASIASFIAGFLIISATLVLSLALLASIWKNETPFNPKNVTKLKIIAWLLMVIEPYHFIAGYIFNKYYPLVLDDGSIISTRIAWNGTIFTAGLVVYCIALVFAYGISLQEQVDELL